MEWPLVFALVAAAFALGFVASRFFGPGISRSDSAPGDDAAKAVEAAVSAAGVGIFQVSGDGRFKFAADQVFELFRTGRGDEAASVFFPAARQLDREELESRWKRALREGVEYEAELCMAVAGKKNRWIAVKARPYGDGLVGAVAEITKAKEEEESRAALALQLNHSQKIESLGLLASGIAHDFNNNLTPIILYASMALRSADLDDRSGRSYRAILEGAQECASLTRQLLTYSRKQPLEMAPVSGSMILSKMEKALGRLVRESIGLVFSYSDDDYVVLVDENQMHQVLVNLVLNAQDAMPEGGDLKFESYRSEVTGAIASAAAEIPPGSYQCIRVTDSGEGIDDEVRARIFEPFFTTKESGKGTGLGLSVVLGIVTQHRGYITAESVAVGGTCFTVYLPVFDATLPAERAAIDEGVYLKGNGQRVLVVEDKATLLALVGKVLGDNGFSVAVADSSERALELVCTDGESFDLLVADIVMPEMNGGDLYRKINSLRPGIRVLFMSGYDSSLIGTDAETFPFLAKPFSDVQLIKKALEALHPIT